MTRAERLAEQEAKAKARLSTQRTRVAKLKQEIQKAEQRERRKRYFLVGQMADDAGLLTMADTDLAALFAALAPLISVAHPGAVLEAVLGEMERHALASLRGCASPAD